MKRRFLYLVMTMILVAFNAFSVSAQDNPPPDRTVGRELPASVETLRLDERVQAENALGDVLDSRLIDAAGEQRVIITLSAESGADAHARGGDSAAAKKAARAQQNAFRNFILQVDPNARLIGSVQMVLNAMFVEVDAAALPVLAQDPRVLRIVEVADYEMDLSETVPYIGATAVQAAGYDGGGIKVAVLDSGIDYLHAALGGSGNTAEFDANDPNVIEPGTFPTAKVVGGYDFVGGNWVSGLTEEPDPDPLDAGPGRGHGTSVAHIIGGVGGVAPGVDLYAVKVCSSVSSSCSGVALIQGMEYAVDPDGDGKNKDRVDIVNMSLGSLYGQPFDDDLSTAVDNATKLGVLSVAAAGNGGDKPYVNDTPGSAPTAISVAQTSVPSAVLAQLRIVAPANIAGLYPAVFQPWSAPLVAPIEGPLQYGDGAGGALNGCSTGADPNSAAPGTEPFAPGSLAGKIVLVDRGVCNFSIKIYNIQRGGGAAGIIGLITPDAPFEGSFGAGGPFTIPGYMVSQATSNTLKSGIPNTVVRLDPADGIPLVQSMVSSSARGPQHDSTTLIKPDVGAPGASVAAVAGSGTVTAAFGGTSGATPMISGSAALLLDKFGGSSRQPLGPGLAPADVKALLMNNAETAIFNDVLTGQLAPITRIGGGEVRVDRALNAPVMAMDANGAAASLSFGFVDVTDSVTMTKEIRIRNIDNKQHTYTVTPTFRFADDEASGAVSVQAPASVQVKPGLGRDTIFKVTLTIDGSLLSGNYMNSGANGASSAALTLNEYDGYLVLQEGAHTINIPWHVLPRKAAQVVPDAQTFAPGMPPQAVGLNNTGYGTAQNDAYSLVAVSDDLPEGGQGQLSPTPDLRAVGVNTFVVPPGFCLDDASFVWAFAINTWERQEHLVPVNHNVYLDINQDGTYDYAVYNFDLSLSGSISDGRQVTWAENLATGSASGWFFTEHATNTGNTVMLVCAEQVGLSYADLLATNVDVAVEAFDWYNGGPGDVIEGLTITPLGEQYFGAPSDVPGMTYDPEGLWIYDFTPFPGNTPELGVLLLTNGDRGTGARGGATQDTEALLFLAE